MALWVFSVLFLLTLLVHSSALYCICQDSAGTQALQKAIDYACGNGADCTSIQQNGPCYLPNTVKDHCNYAVNSYYQMEVSSGGTCDFSGVATISSTPPSTASSGCVYASSSSNGTTGTSPSLTPPTAITPGTGTPGSPNEFGTSPPPPTSNGAVVIALESAFTKLLLPLLLTTAWLIKGLRLIIY